MAKGTCSYCGLNAHFTKEHIFPKWSRKIVPISKVLSSNRFTGEVKNRDAGTITIRSVCKSCNGGWMSAVQSAAKPVLSEFIAGSWRALDFRECSAIENWAIMTTASYDCDLGSDPAIPATVKRAFSAGDFQKNLFDVWIGLSSIYPSRGINRIGFTPSNSNRLSTLTTTQIGSFACATLYNYNANDASRLREVGLTRISQSNVLTIPKSRPELFIPARAIPDFFSGGGIPPFSPMNRP